jgi:hypothetical protein
VTRRHVDVDVDLYLYLYVDMNVVLDTDVVAVVCLYVQAHDYVSVCVYD